MHSSYFHVTPKKLRRRKLLNVAASVIFPTSMMILFEINHRFKDHFLNKLHVSYNYEILCLFSQHWQCTS